MNNLKKGDYVLATKYSDGSAADKWIVGFYVRKDGERYVVSLDGETEDFYRFGRCEKISSEVGEYILTHRRELETMAANLWKIPALRLIY